ncbi:MAG TPA: PilZ domain-containing protein [Rectinemataceae bacterium]|nr:PilZ domain-containing protein [Rectinemataceae bacterium]
MATALKRIEKEFMLGAARDERTKVLLLAGSGEWPVEIRSVESDHIILGHSMPLRLLRKGIRYEFRFVVREQAMAFRTRIIEIKDSSLKVEMPANVYRNLERRYSRRSPPAELTVAFSFMGERFELSYPTTREYATVAQPVPSESFDPNDIRGLVRSFNERTEDRVSDRSIVMFKDRRPESIEERVITRTGRSLFLATVAGGLPEIDPLQKPRIVTRKVFTEWLREEGFSAELALDELARFERNLRQSGTLSELLIPILFQEYVIGYVSLVNKTPGREPFDLGMLETFHIFSQILAWSLKINGYFKGAPRKASEISARVLDVSAGGLLFANDSADIGASLRPESRIDLLFTLGERKVKASAVVRRTWTEGNQSYYGLEYDGIQPEDFRFLFETLYGRPFTDADGLSIEGLAVRKAVIDFGAKK